MNEATKLRIEFADGHAEEAIGDDAAQIWSALVNADGLMRIRSGVQWTGPKLKIIPPAPPAEPQGPDMEQRAADYGRGYAEGKMAEPVSSPQCPPHRWVGIYRVMNGYKTAKPEGMEKESRSDTDCDSCEMTEGGHAYDCPEAQE